MRGRDEIAQRSPRESIAGFGKIGEGMADEGGVDSAIAVELFFEGKNHKSFVDVFAEQAHASLTPCPELRRDVVDDGNAALFHLPRDAPVEGRRVDDDGEVGFALVGFGDQVSVQAEILADG